MNSQGLTLMECLMAITVIAVSAGAMLPPLFVASATRVQNRKAEQAMQLAQGEIDRVRAVVEQQSFDPAVLPATTFGGTAINDINAVAAPTDIADRCRSINSNNNNYIEGELIDGALLLPIDIDGIANPDDSCEPEFLLQTFRSNGQTFRMGVRVYTGNVDPKAQSLGTTQAALKYTTGTGQQAVNPLAVMYTDISDVNQSDSMCRFQRIQDC